MEPKTGKKIVSKGAYVQQIALRAVWTTLSALLYVVVAVLIVFFFPLLVLCAVLDVITGRRSPIMLVAYTLETHRKPSCYRMTSLVSGEVITLVQIASRSFKAARDRANQIDPGVPLTRANTADLPAPDTLVRASSEPVQEQQAVLLRAAAEGMETPPEQLVRAVGGKK